MRKSDPYENQLRALLRGPLYYKPLRSARLEEREVPEEFAVLDYDRGDEPDDETWEWLMHPDCPVVVTRHGYNRQRRYKVYLAPAPRGGH
jgi:hypothetical protein